MLSKQAQDVLDVLKTEPVRCWTATAISAKLNCAPEKVRARLKRLCETGYTERVCEGEYRVVSEAKRGVRGSHSRFTFDVEITETAISGNGEIPKNETVKICVTDLMQEQLLGALRIYGQPLQPSTLAGRLKRSGFNLHAVTATAAVLVSAGKLKRLDDGKLSLPAWKVA